MSNDQYSPSYAPNSEAIQRLDFTKDFFSKSSVLALGIACTINAIISLIISILTTNATPKILSVLAKYLNGDYSSASVFVSSYTSIIISFAVSLLPAIGIFMIYFKSKNPSPQSSPTSGFTLLYVLSIIQLVITAIISLVLLIFSIILLVMGSSVQESNSTTSLFGIFIFLAIIILVIIAVMLLWSISMVRFIGSARNNIKPLTMLQAKGAQPIGVLSIIAAVFTIISFISSIITQFVIVPTLADYHAISSDERAIKSIMNEISGVISPIMLLSTIAIAVGAIIYILYAVVALGYKKHVFAPNAPNVTPLSPYGGTTFGGGTFGGYANGNSGANTYGGTANYTGSNGANTTYGANSNTYGSNDNNNTTYGAGSNPYSPYNNSSSPYGSNTTYGTAGTPTYSNVNATAESNAHSDDTVYTPKKAPEQYAAPTPFTDAPTSEPVSPSPFTNAPTSEPVSPSPFTDAPTSEPVSPSPFADAPTSEPAPSSPFADAPTSGPVPPSPFTDDSSDSAKSSPASPFTGFSDPEEYFKRNMPNTSNESDINNKNV